MASDGRTMLVDDAPAGVGMEALPEGTLALDGAGCLGVADSADGSFPVAFPQGTVWREGDSIVTEGETIALGSPVSLGGGFPGDQDGLDVAPCTPGPDGVFLAS